MPRKPKPDPEKYCTRCGVRLQRKRYNGTLEDMTRFRARIYCCLRCANSRGIKSRCSSTQHKISQAMRGSRCESCGKVPQRQRDLHAHHINKDWTDHRPENIKTLCVGCHLKLHTNPPPPCVVCGAKSRKHKMCQKHFQRWKKYGDPLLTRKVGGRGCEIVRVGPSD